MLLGIGIIGILDSHWIPDSRFLESIWNHNNSNYGNPNLFKILGFLRIFSTHWN
jgi:hypothetical protein